MTSCGEPSAVPGASGSRIAEFLPRRGRIAGFLPRLSLALGFLNAPDWQGLQAQQRSAVTVSGLAYAQYDYRLSDTAQGNAFDLTRAYLTVLGRPSDKVATRFTADMYRAADGSLAYRVKYAYAAYAPGGGGFTAKLGVIQTPWLDWEETLWDYRMQGPMALDRAGYLSSADLGLGVDGSVGGGRIETQVALVNGENYNKLPGDRHKDLMGRISVRLLRTDDAGRTGGLRLTGYGQLGAPTGGGVRDRMVGMLSYRSELLTLAVEIARTRDAAGSPRPPVAVGSVLSAFGAVRIPRSSVSLIARMDRTDPNTAARGDRTTRLIAGLAYQLAPGLKLLGDLDHLVYEGIPTPAEAAQRSHALFQIQFSF